MKKTLLAILIVASSFATAKNNILAPSNPNITQQFNTKPVVDVKVVKYFHDLLPSTTISAIYTTPYKNTYALIAGQTIFYGNTDSSFIMVGNLFNPYTQQNITSDMDDIRLQNTKIDVKKINLSDSIVTKGTNNINGKKIIIFEDPDCPYCRVLEKQLKNNGIKNNIDIYRILMPLPMHPNAKTHIQNIYCTKNNNSIEVMDKYMVDGEDKQDVNLKDGCNIDKLLERTGDTVRYVGVNATPTIVLGNGKLIQGADINAIIDYAGNSHPQVESK
ncbi:MAG: DsbC family protein [Burkholderiales bacterium]|nr:DsbC family protein [Burkholderiales bacterium]